MSKEQGYDPTVKVKEHVRHINKTYQDKQPVADRQRVKDWQKRLNNMKED